MEYINETEAIQKVLIHDNDTEFILIEVQARQHLATHLTKAVIVQDFAEAQALFPTKTIIDTTVPPERPIPQRRLPDEEDE
jgi:hypothetical protein